MTEPTTPSVAGPTDPDDGETTAAYPPVKRRWRFWPIMGILALAVMVFVPLGLLVSYQPSTAQQAISQDMQRTASDAPSSTPSTAPSTSKPPQAAPSATKSATPSATASATPSASPSTSRPATTSPPTTAPKQRPAQDVTVKRPAPRGPTSVKTYKIKPGQGLFVIAMDIRSKGTNIAPKQLYCQKNNRALIGPDWNKIPAGGTLIVDTDVKPTCKATTTKVQPKTERKATAGRSAGKTALPRSSGKYNWDAVAWCESRGHGLWKANTGNGYSGGLQFAPSTWNGHGGQQYAKYAYQASREQQIVVAERVVKTQGLGAWPLCGKNAHKK